MAQAITSVPEFRMLGVLQLFAQTPRLLKKHDSHQGFPSSRRPPVQSKGQKQHQNLERQRAARQ